MWSKHFDDTIQEELHSKVTGKPWSLYEYNQRVKYEPWQECEEMVSVMFAHLHALHLQGADAFEEIGMCIRQYYKALEQASRDRDWSLAWPLTDLPDPRPKTRYQRGLAHPAEYAASISYLREKQALLAHQQTILKGKGKGKPFTPGTPGGGGAGGSPPGAEGGGADDAAALGEDGQPKKGRKKR